MEQCITCGHAIGRHVQCVDGRVRCFCIESGMTTGVIMPYTDMCDCVDYRSERAEYQEAERKRESEEFKRDLAERMKNIRKIESVDELFDGE